MQQILPLNYSWDAFFIKASHHSLKKKDHKGFYKKVVLNDIKWNMTKMCQVDYLKKTTPILSISEFWAR